MGCTPVLVAIHSSLVSTKRERSSLVSLAAGTLLPLPMSLHPSIACPAWHLVTVDGWQGRMAGSDLI